MEIGRPSDEDVPRGMRRCVACSTSGRHISLLLSLIGAMFFILANLSSQTSVEVETLPYVSQGKLCHAMQRIKEF